ncbi:ParB/RepB/Spo0J family partition protein [Vibrio alginolyticus]|nr:ParB/RepB/Spo0J family partition protein [Vibrio alginolyticus]ELA6641121.1 ParB/RepB/Spo0J family partition protein [Vibrio alginolyticus]ELB2861220.1 ParB/RepB/Spo0J family partition protein [Vibrio alginolyticus]
MSLRGKLTEDMLDESDVRLLEGEKITRIPKDSLYSGEQVRKTFNNIEELAASIENDGQLQPVAVYPMDGRGYLIQEGERRWRACMFSKKITHVDCIIRTESNIFRQLAENIHKDALNAVEISEAIAKIKEKYNLNSVQVAERLSLSKASVSAYEGIKKAPEFVIKAYEDGIIGDVETINALRIASDIDPESVKNILETSEYVSRNDAKQIARDKKAEKKGVAPKKEKAPEANRPLSALLGTCNGYTVSIAPKDNKAPQGTIKVLWHSGEKAGTVEHIEASEVLITGYGKPE